MAAIFYGIDLLCPTTIQGDDGWRPLTDSLHKERKKFRTLEDLFAALDQLKISQPNIQTRIIEISDPFEPRYTL